MKYNDLLQYLYEQFPCFQHVGKSAYVPSLQNIVDLLNVLGNPEKNIPCIHVAGTNGKGSVSHFIASILQESGYKVGLYTSPHIVDFRERIRVDGANISFQFLNSIVKKHSLAFESIKPSLFELTTAIAFAYFKQQNVDVIVLETGLGGRLDATNVITPKLSIITNIGFDHTQILGDSLAKIAQEKAGIIKPLVPVVIGEYSCETAPVFEEYAKKSNSRIVFASEKYTLESSQNDWFKSFNIVSKEGLGSFRAQSGLFGMYQKKNILTVYAAIQELQRDFTISKRAIKQGLLNVIQNTNLIGRWQTVRTNPLVVCDTGHNYDGMSCTMSQLQSLGSNDIRIVWGMVSDKDIDSIISLLPDSATYYLCAPQIERAMPLDRLELYFKEKKYKKYKNILRAYNAAKSSTSDSSVIYVGGSSYVVADFLSKKSGKCL